MELLRHELYKIYHRKLVYLAALFLIAVGFVYETGSLRTITQNGDMAGLYAKYYSRYEGPVGAEARAFAQKVLSDWSWLKNEIPEKDFYNYATGIQQLAYQIQSADERAETWKNQLSVFRETLARLETHKETDTFLYRDTKLQYEMLESLGTPGVSFALPWQEPIFFPEIFGFAFIMALILLGVAPSFSEEYATGVDALILSSRKGRWKITGAKVLACMLYSASVAVFLLLLNFLFNAAQTGFLGWSSPLQSLTFFTDSFYPLQAGPFFLLQSGLCILGSVLFGLFVLFVSSLCRNVLLPFAGCGGIYMVLYFVAAAPGSMPKWAVEIARFGYSELMRVVPMFWLYRSYNLFGHPVLYPYLLPPFLLLVTGAFVCLTFVVFRRRQVR